MNEELKRDVKMIELCEALVEFYIEHDQPDLAKHYDWPLEVYDRLEERNVEVEQLKEQLKEQEEYIRDWQIGQIN